LNNLTRVPGDFLLFEVTPNPDFENTDWVLYISCVEQIDCGTNCIQQKTPYKIIESTITGYTASCETLGTFQYTVSGCTTDEVNQSAFYKYLFNYGLGLTAYPYADDLALGPSSNGQYNISTSLSYISTSCNVSGFYNAPDDCDLSSSNSIYFRTYRPNSTQRFFEWKFESYNELLTYTDSYSQAMTQSGSTNPLTSNYYRRMLLVIPPQSGTLPCGDDTPLTYNMHPASLVLSSGTTIDPLFNYILQITASTISDGLNYGSCSPNCDSIVKFNIVNTTNNSTTGSTNDYTGTTTVGSRYQYPFNQVFGLTTASTPTTSGATFGRISIYEYINQTIPASGSPLQVITTLTSDTCNLSSFMGEVIPNLWQQWAYRYIVVLTNPSDVRDFRIYASPITNGAYDGFPGTVIYSDFVYGFSAGTVYHTDPTYLI
jgi:hypothetical protein